MAISAEELRKIARNIDIEDVNSIAESIADAIIEAYKLGKKDGINEAKEVAIKTVEDGFKQLKIDLKWKNIIRRMR